MRQFIQMLGSDLMMAFKSFYGAYVIVAPMLILIVLRLFLPSVESTTVTVAAVTEGPNAVEKGLIEDLEAFADVERYESIESMEAKLRGAGSAEGLYWDPEAEQYVSVMERNIPDNARFSVGARVVRQHYLERQYPDAPRVTSFSASVPAALSDRTENSPVATMGGAIFIAIMVIMSGFLIGLSIVRDKELGTDKAIRVSPVTRTEYYLAKSTFPILVLLFYVFVGLAILGLLEVNILQVYLIAGLSISIVLVFGLLVGALAKNETEAIGVVKSLGMLLMMGLLGGALLPDGWKWVVYWTPLYWIFDAAQSVFTLTATWGEVAWKSGVVAAISLVVFVLLQKRIAKGLS